MFKWVYSLFFYHDSYNAKKACRMVKAYCPKLF
jgi:hypothetical protein